MRIATVDPFTLMEWARLAWEASSPGVGDRAELHVLAQGYELRCADAPPLQLEPDSP